MTSTARSGPVIRLARAGQLKNGDLMVAHAIAPGNRFDLIAGVLP